MAGGRRRQGQRGCGGNDSHIARCCRLYRVDLCAAKQNQLWQRKECVRSVHKGEPGEYYSSGFRREDAGGLPCVDYQSTGEDSVSNRQLYVAADSNKSGRQEQGEVAERPCAVVPGQRRSNGERPVLCASAQRSG